MNADHLSYQRAVTVSIIGLIAQVVLGVALLLYGIFGPDRGAMAGSILVLLGVPVWFGVALVFHQHKRERLEALENEAYRQSGMAETSVFEDESGERVQADRLAWMHKWFLPTLSLLVAGGFITSCLVRFGTDLSEYAERTPFVGPGEPGWGIGIGVGLAAAGFVLGRFVAGMAKQRVWSLLNAGAASAVGAALVGAILALAHFLAIADIAVWPLKYVPVVIDVLMGLLGLEILLNFVLTIYRPRKAGEFLRPAFDSRVLAFLAAPDRLAESISEAINYQFGFDVSSTWFYKLVSRSIIGLAVLCGLTLWLLTAVVVVQPHERALLLDGGQVVGEELDSGLVFKKPWPFAKVERFPARSMQRILIGSPMATDESEPLLWTTQSPTGQELLLVRAASTSGGLGDENAVALAAGEVPVHYVVRSLRDYLGLGQDGPSDDPEAVRRSVLEAAAAREVTRFMLLHDLEGLLGPRRAELEDALRLRIQSAYDAMDAGVELLFVGLQGFRPPQETATDFEQVEGARYFRDALVSQAQALRIRTLSAVVGDIELAESLVEALEELDAIRESVGPDASGEEQVRLAEAEKRVQDLLLDAGGEASIEVARARADRWSRVLSERARAEAWQGLVRAFRAAPETFKAQRYVEALQEAAQGKRVWISPFEIRVTIDQKEINPDLTGAGVLDAVEEANQPLEGN